MKPDAHGESLGIPEAVRKVVDFRDQQRCRVCGKYLGDRRALHHIIYGGDARGMGGRRVHNADEIATVCWMPGDPQPGTRSCHELVHSNKALWQSLLLEVVKSGNLTALQLLRWRRRKKDRNVPLA